MVKRFEILLLTFLIILILTKPGRPEEPIRQGLLRDGFALSSIDGEVNGSDGDAWFFKLDSDVIDDKTVARKGTSLQLLASATLQRIIDDMKIRSAGNYCLWGRVTKYKGKNFIFPIYFLPLSKVEQPQEQKPLETTVKEKDKSEPNINEPNDILAIPPEIIEKIKTMRSKLANLQDTEPTGQTRESQTPQWDIVMADRTAFLVKQDDQPAFILDALGRSAPKISLRLLPCEALELTEQRQSAELEQPTFKIAGIITKYKDQNYLLLQKATIAYSHGNFAR